MRPDNFRVIVIGNRTHSKQVLQHLIRDGWNVVRAIGAETSSEQAGYTPLSGVSRETDIPLIEVNDINSDQVIERLKNDDPDLAICCGWTQIISEKVLEIPAIGVVGLHFSPLPKGRGGAPVNWQIIRGETQVGVSLFFFTPEVDHGDILAQTTVPVGPRDDIATVYNRLTLASCDVLERTLPKIESDDIAPRPQSFDDASYFPKRKPKDGLINWNRSAFDQHNWIRALTKPYPGAFSFFEGNKLLIWKASFAETEASNLKNGEVIRIIDGIGMDVCTGGDAIRLKRVQMEDRPAMWADELAQRYGITAGTIIGKPEDFPHWLYTGIRDSTGGFEYETNIVVGETGTVQAVCCSHSSLRNLNLIVTFDGDRLVSEEMTVDGWTTRDITFTVPSRGAHTLKFIFEEEDKIIDSRYLKIYGSSCT